VTKKEKEEKAKESTETVSLTNPDPAKVKEILEKAAERDAQ
jgi:hypothetical protein